MRTQRVIPQLPRSAWVLLAGESVSAVGAGLTLPFLFVYLTRVRGLDAALVGVALTAIAAAGFLGNALGGWLSDRLGARRTLTVGLLLAAVGAAAFALVRSPLDAVSAATFTGLGAGLAVPSQDAVLAGAVAAERRSEAFSARYATMNLGLGIGSVGGALVADLASPATFELMFLVQGATLAAYAMVAAFRPGAGSRGPAGAGERVGGYRLVLADRALRRLLPVVALLFAVGYAQYHTTFAAFATGPGALAPSGLGAAFAANTFIIVATQLIVAKRVARISSRTALALVGLVWAAAWIVVFGAASLGGGHTAPGAFALAMVLFGLGETILAPTLGPLVNELAADELRGRYNGACALAQTTGYTLGPAIAGVALGRHLDAALVLGLGAMCVIAAAQSLRIHGRAPEPRLPASLRPSESIA